LRGYTLAILNDDHLIYAVGLYQLDLYCLVSGAWYVPADIVGPDRQLAMTAVYQHG
jgi:hypothetical protein